MSGNIFFSIIISVFNGEKYIEDALESVCNQTNKNYELICINDGSVDNTEDKIKKFRNRIKNFIYIKQKNIGLASSRNKALKIAKGKYIQFLDADDKLVNECCQELFAFLNKHDLDMCSFSGWNYEQKTLYLNNYWQYDKIPYKLLNKALEPCALYKYIFSLPVSSCLTIYKNSFLKSINSYFPDGYNFEDNIFFYNSFFKAKLYGILKKNLYIRRIHNLQVTKIYDERLFDCFFIYKSCLKIFYNFMGPYYTYQYFKRKIKFLRSLNKYFLDEKSYEWAKQIKFFEDFYNNLKIKEKIGINYLKNISSLYLNRYYIDALKHYIILSTLNNKYNKIFKFQKEIILNKTKDTNGYYLIHEAHFPYIPKISLAVILFNKSFLIDYFIEIINKQSLKEIEIILIDYSSTDCTLVNAIDLAQKNKNISLYLYNKNDDYDAIDIILNKFKGEYLCLMKIEETYHNEHFLTTLYKNTLSTKCKDNKIIYNNIFCQIKEKI